MRSEFDLIQNLKEKYSLKRVGDDCAVLPKNDAKDLLITADLLVEDIDFRLEWTTPEYLGHKALAVSLSDVAAMGGTAEWSMLSLAIPEQIWATDFVDRFYSGWFELANKYSIELIGGDISRSPEKLVIDSIVGGEVPKGKAILRSTAKLGDHIFVSGSLGGAAGGLRRLENSLAGDIDFSKCVLRQLKPTPQLVLANQLQELRNLTSMIDISDGLSSDLWHICHESSVGAVVYADLIPVESDLAGEFGPETAFEMALNGGEDYELLFTSAEKNILVPENCQITRIGEITSNTGIIELIRDGKSEILEPKGYRHF